MPRSTSVRLTLTTALAAALAATAGNAPAAPVIFFLDPFDSNTGWSLTGDFQIGPAVASPADIEGNRDPDTDTSPGNSNGVAGTAIGRFTNETGHRISRAFPGLPDYAGGELTFYSWIPPAEFIELTVFAQKISIGSGVSVEIPTGSGWRFNRIDISSVIATPFRLEFTVDTDVSRAGISIDDVQITLDPVFRFLGNPVGPWDSASNWAPGRTPGRASEALFAPDRDQTIVGPTDDTTVAKVTLGGGAGRASFLLSTGALTTTGGFSIESTGRLASPGLIFGDVVNRGEIGASGLTVRNGVVENHGTIRGTRGADDRLVAEVENKAAGEIEVRRGERLTLGGAVANEGRIAVIEGDLTVEGLLTNRAGGRIQARDALLDLDGGLVNAGQIQISEGKTDVFGRVENRIGGVIVNAGSDILTPGGSVLTFWDELANAGEVRTAEGSRTVVFGLLSGPGIFTGSGRVDIEGGLSGGASPGLVTFAGDAVFGDLSSSLFEIGGLLRGTEYDAVDVGGTLTLGGTLTVSLLGGFTPKAGDVFDLFLASQILGGFDGLALPALAGLNWDVIAGTGRFALAVRADATPAPIPLPAGGWLLLSGLAALAAARRGRRPRSPST